jgi:hypothetical protein
MFNLTKLIISLINESLDVERQTYNSPEEDFTIEVDPENPDEGIIHYIGYEFPISKTLKAGGVQYFVGSLGSGKIIAGDKFGAFKKVKHAIMNGEVNPSVHTNTGGAVKVPRQLPDTVEIETKQGTKTYHYVAPGEVDHFVTTIYNKYGPDKYLEVLKDFATDRPSGDIHNPYIALNQTVRQNVFTHKLGSKGNAVNRKT